MRLLALLPIIGLLIGCKSKLDAEAPQLAENIVIEQPTYSSSLRLPIKVDMKPIYAESNRSIPREFKGHEKLCEGVSYNYTFVRKDIKFKGNEEGLQYTIPASYGINLEYCPKCTDLLYEEGSCVIPRVYASCGIDEPKRRVEITYLTKIAFGKDLKLHSKTKLDGFRSIDPCKVTVFNYNATAEVEKEVIAALEDGAKDIDKEIEALTIQKDIQLALKRLREPFDLAELGNLYLNPAEISTTPFKFNQDKLSFDLQLIANPSIGKQSKVNNVQRLDTINGFNIQLPVRIGFDSLSLFLQNQIGGTKFQFKKNKLVIDSLNVIGTNDLGINISVKISGSKKGTIYVYGQPQFDPQLQELRLTNIQLTLSSKNVLLKTAKWLLDQKIEKTLEAKSVIKIEDQLIHAKKLISEKLNGEISDGIQLKTELRTMKLTSLKLSEKDLQLWLQFLGDASVNISTAP